MSISDCVPLPLPSSLSALKPCLYTRPLLAMDNQESLHTLARRKVWSSSLSRQGLILEAWSEGWFICGMVILSAVTIANMNRRLLHILILIEASSYIRFHALPFTLLKLTAQSHPAPRLHSTRDDHLLDAPDAKLDPVDL